MTEEELCGAIREFVTAESGFTVDGDDNFFAAGLTSAQLVGMHGRLAAALGRDLPVYLLVAYPTSRSLAQRLATPDVDPVPAAGPDGAAGWTPQARRALRARVRQLKG